MNIISCEFCGLSFPARDQGGLLFLHTRDFYPQAYSASLCGPYMSCWECARNTSNWKRGDSYTCLVCNENINHCHYHPVENKIGRPHMTCSRCCNEDGFGINSLYIQDELPEPMQNEEKTPYYYPVETSYGLIESLFTQAEAWASV